MQRFEQSTALSRRTMHPGEKARVPRTVTVARSVDVAIVGGGIVGASCAYFLADRGAPVLLMESGRIGREASGVNAGGVRQQARALPEMPLALRSLDLWA